MRVDRGALGPQPRPPHDVGNRVRQALGDGLAGFPEPSACRKVRVGAGGTHQTKAFGVALGKCQVRIDSAVQTLHRVVRRRHCLPEHPHQAVDVLVDDRQEDLDLATGEVAIEDGLGDPGQPGERFDLCVPVPPLAEQLPGGVEQPAAPFLPGEADLLGHESYLT